MTFFVLLTLVGPDRLCAYRDRPASPRHGTEGIDSAMPDVPFVLFLRAVGCAYIYGTTVQLSTRIIIHDGLECTVLHCVGC